MRQKIFALFIAALLFSYPHIAFANEEPVEYFDSRDALLESDDKYDDGNAASPEENEDELEGIFGGEVLPEYDDEDANNDTDLPEEDESDEDESDEAIGNEVLPEVDDEHADADVDAEFPEEDELEEIPVAEAFMEESFPEYIGSQNELLNWINNHPEGGSVSLSQNITITNIIWLYEPLCIDTGAYGITFDGGFFYQGFIDITGEGVENPVLTLKNMGMGSNTWDSILTGYNIIARGRDGIGGTAVRVSLNKNSSADFIETQGLIRSEGMGAVGIHFDNYLKARFLSVSVEGENSSAISADRGVDLYYSKLEAFGTGSRAASGSNILLDACKITGNASGVDVADRKIVALAGNWLYWPLAQGINITHSSLYRTFGIAAPIQFLLSGDENHPAEVRKMYCVWDTSAITNIDTSSIGKTVVSGELFGGYEGLGLEDSFSLDLTVDVLDGTRPWIISLKFGNEPETGRSYVYFNTCDFVGLQFEPVYGNFILWRSDDEGTSWHDITDSPDVLPEYERGITYYFDKITEPVWFCIQEVGGEYSNIVIVSGYEGNTIGALGGDRTGVDRDGDDSRPPAVPDEQPTVEPDDEQSTANPDDEQSSPDPSVDQYNHSTSDTSANSNDRSTSAKPTAAMLPIIDAIVEHASLYLSPEPTVAFAQTMPSSNSSPEPSDTVAEPPKEWENDTTVAISGKRLLLLMNSSDTVTFVKNGARLSIASSALETLNIDDRQLFTVTVERSESRQYTVSAALGESLLYELPCVATLDGKDYDIFVSGSIYAGEAMDEPALAQELSASTADDAKPSLTFSDTDAKKPDAYEEKPAPPVNGADEEPMQPVNQDKKEQVLPINQGKEEPILPRDQIKEKPSSLPAAGWTVLVFICTAGTAAIIRKFRFKAYER